jgi:hypothetical protein
MSGGTGAEAGRLTGTVVGAVAGAEVGTVAIPVPVVGSFVGAVVGAMVGSEAGGFLAATMSKVVGQVFGSAGRVILRSVCQVTPSTSRTTPAAQSVSPTPTAGAVSSIAADSSVFAEAPAAAVSTPLTPQDPASPPRAVAPLVDPNVPKANLGATATRTRRARQPKPAAKPSGADSTPPSV